MSFQWERPMVDGEACEAGACVECAPVWEKSLFSGATNCVEVAPTWEKSARSDAVDSVEVSDYEGGALVRDSKLGDDSPMLRFTREEWKAFRDAIKAGQFAYDEQREHAAL